MLLGLALLSSSCSSTHSCTSHLHCVNDNFLWSSEFETFEREVTYLDALAETQLGNIDFELFRNSSIRSLNAQLTYHTDQLTTGTYTFCQALSSDRKCYYDSLVICYFIEVNVQNIVLNWVELNFLYNCLVFNTVDVYDNEVNMRSVNHLVDFLFIYCEMDSFWQTVFTFLFTVDNARNFTVLTYTLCSLLTEVSTKTAVDCNLLHNKIVLL
ncbi:secreted protein [gut metagenome]|uniref:Secreted protein n=1 Tax=gut metagenome TaxID=749906 RepID=J9H345_9ZZZZ